MRWAPTPVRRLLLLAMVLLPRLASAEGRLLDDDAFAVTSSGNLALDAGLLVATPAALPSGLSTGIAAGITRNCGCHFSYGARASWSTVTEGSQFWTVSHDDIRLRAVGAVRHTVGRGSVGLRLGLGTTIVHETRTRTQGMGAGRTDLDTTAWAALPALDLEALFAVHVTGAWVANISAGPSFDRADGALRTGWVMGLGVAWEP